MACQVLVCNKAGSIGEIVSIVDSDSVWTSNESLKEWIIRYPQRPLSEYHRNFTLLKITDEYVNGISYISSAKMIGGEPVNKWYFVEPDRSSALWSELFTTGQISKAWAEVLPYLRERN